MLLLDVTPRFPSSLQVNGADRWIQSTLTFTRQNRRCREPVCREHRRPCRVSNRLRQRCVPLPAVPSARPIHVPREAHVFRELDAANPPLRLHWLVCSKQFPGQVAPASADHPVTNGNAHTYADTSWKGITRFPSIFLSGQRKMTNSLLTRSSTACSQTAS